MKRTVVLADGLNAVYRSAHTYGGLSTKDGRPSGAIYGVLSGLYSLAKHVKTDYSLIMFWEGGALLNKPVKSWRAALQTSYKAQREKSQATLEAQLQIPAIADACKALRIPQVFVPGLEADDLIGIVSATLEAQDTVDRVLIYSTDKDFYQCCSRRVSVLRMNQGRAEFVTPDTVQKQYEVPASLFAEYKALVGDVSDNYKGAPGVGPASAVAMINAGVRPSLPEFTSHSRKVRDLYGAKLQQAWPDVHRCFQLAYIPRAADYKLFPTPLSKYAKQAEAAAVAALRSPNSPKEYQAALREWTAFCSEWEFTSFLADRRKYLTHLL